MRCLALLHFSTVAHTTMHSAASTLLRWSKPARWQDGAGRGFLARAFSAAAGADEGALRVAVVGTGPGGFYAAKYLLKEHSGIHIDMIDRLPVPYGLVRFGVAPDHPEVKSVMNDFSAVAEEAGERFNFLGGLDIGVDVSVATLRRYYDAVILANGAQGDTRLSVPGDTLGNVLTARAFVNWYNGHPDFVDLDPDLSVEHAVVIGNGNVAIDCARVLAKTADELAVTDIADHAVEALRRSNIKRVSILGRRGHVQASFTMKELRELTKLDHADLFVEQAELDAGMTESSGEEISQHRAKKRMNQLLNKSAAPGALDSMDQALADSPDKRQIALRFLVSPTELLPSDADESVVGAVRCVTNKLTGEPNRQRAHATDETSVIPAGLVLESIGYKSLPLEGVPFNDDSNVINNYRGAVIDEYTGEPVPGLYCSGWVKRGPTGIIGTNIPDARETVALLLRDAESGALPKAEVEGGGEALLKSLDGSVAAGGVVDWDGYMRIESEERRRGEGVGKPFAKMVDVAEMLRVAACE